MEELGAAIAVGIFMGLVFGLGRWLFRMLAGRLDARLGTRWLTLPIVAILSFAGFLLLQPLVVDQPRTPLWFVLGFVAIALLVACGTALAYGAMALGKWFLEVVRGR